jgi:hypothetical protein
VREPSNRPAKTCAAHSIDSQWKATRAHKDEVSVDSISCQEAPDGGGTRLKRFDGRVACRAHALRGRVSPKLHVVARAVAAVDLAAVPGEFVTTQGRVYMSPQVKVWLATTQKPKKR